MMPRRALHLRWNYVEDHRVLFGGFLLALVGAAALIAILVDNPLRGLLIGALPVLFALIVWAFTNGASYRLRHPDSLPEERIPMGEPIPAKHEGDPFADTPQTLSPAELAKRNATSKKKPPRFRKKKSDVA